MLYNRIALAAGPSSVLSRAIGRPIRAQMAARSLSGIPSKYIVKPRTSNTQHMERMKSSHPKIHEILTRAVLSTAGHFGSTAETSSVTRPIQQKRMQDSYVEEYLRFKSDPSFKEEYVNMYGAIRIGKILEDLDALAGSIAYLHCDDGPDFPINKTIVTASLDRIDMTSQIPPDQDIKLSGHVTHVGTSSMEITITMETCQGLAPPVGQERIGPLDQSETAIEKTGDPILKAKFIMVATDRSTGKTTPVHTLRLETDPDRALFLAGAEHRARKHVNRQMSLDKSPPSVEEMLLIHSLYQEYKQYLDPSFHVEKPKNVIWMKDTVQKSLVLCMPQDRNIHNKIFGGYLMRLAMELAYSTGYIFTGSRITFVALDDVTFRRPVSIGSLLSLKSRVVYSKGSPTRSFQVKVKADVIDPIAGTQDTTNYFQFTFAVPLNTELPRVMPRSYDETMLYIEGQRLRDRWVMNAIMPKRGKTPEENVTSEAHSG